MRVLLAIPHVFAPRDGSLIIATARETRTSKLLFGSVFWGIWIDCRRVTGFTPR